MNEMPFIDLLIEQIHAMLPIGSTCISPIDSGDGYGAVGKVFQHNEIGVMLSFNGHISCHSWTPAYRKGGLIFVQQANTKRWGNICRRYGVKDEPYTPNYRPQYGAFPKMEDQTNV